MRIPVGHGAALRIELGCRHPSNGFTERAPFPRLLLQRGWVPPTQEGTGGPDGFSLDLEKGLSVIQ